MPQLKKNKYGDKGLYEKIRYNKLGFDKIYLQAKRWNKGNSRDVRYFIEILTIKQAIKGLFITAAKFPEQF
jgi:restriction system protein